jgi:hypothetical protein
MSSRRSAEATLIRLSCAADAGSAVTGLAASILDYVRVQATSQSSPMTFGDGDLDGLNGPPYGRETENKGGPSDERKHR